MDWPPDFQSPLDYDEEDTIPLDYAGFIKNMETRRDAYHEGKWDRLFPNKAGIQFNKVTINGNTLVITKVYRGFSSRGVDYYHRTSGTIKVALQPFQNKTKARARIRPTLAGNGMRIFVMVFTGIWGLLFFNFFNANYNYASILIVILLEAAVFASFKMDSRERYLALKEYYKNYLFNVINT